MTKILLRPVLDTDLPILFQQQLDPEAIAMSADPPRDWGPFMLHWEKIMKDKAVLIRIIVFKGKVAGHILGWKEGYERRVGYWLGRQYWGRGIASAALAEFLGQEKNRPLYSYVAINNIASRRVLEKCGFVMHEQGRKEYVLKLSSEE